MKAALTQVLPSLISDSRSRVRTTLLWFFLQFCQFHMCTIQEQSRGKSFLERFLSNSQNQKKLDPFSMQILLGVCLLNFWFHIVNLGKIPFHLIGRTLYFCKEFKFSFFGSPLLGKKSAGNQEDCSGKKVVRIWKPRCISNSLLEIHQYHKKSFKIK